MILLKALKSNFTIFEGWMVETLITCSGLHQPDNDRVL